MFMLKAVGSQKIKRIIYFALAGISFGLGFHSRVNSVVPLAIVAVAFVLLWAIKRFKEKQVGTLFAEMAALGTPVVIAVVASMLIVEMASYYQRKNKLFCNCDKCQ